MKYKLINIKTKKEHLCDKVTIDGFDYYVNNEIPKENNFATDGLGIFRFHSENPCQAIICNPKKIIATNNPNIDIPKVVDEVDKLAYEHCDRVIPKDVTRSLYYSFKCGYNKSQETHPYSEEDMIEFGKFCDKRMLDSSSKLFGKILIELLQFWKEQQPKIVYYQ